jgi:sterol desaturase/sphingolipid hydroxylase (fatty acid hydroxylase superfamily)
MLLIADFAAWRSPQIQVHSEFDYHNCHHHEPIATVLSPSRADPIQATLHRYLEVLL